MHITFPSVSGPADVRAIEAQPLEHWLGVDSVHALFQHAGAVHGERSALVYLAHGELDTPVERVSYSQLATRVVQAANVLHSLGVQPGDTVGILAPNMPETHYAMWGAEIIGRACPINVLLEPEHVAALIKAAGIRVIVALGPDGDLPIWSQVRQLCDRVELEHVVMVGDQRARVTSDSTASHSTVDPSTLEDGTTDAGATLKGSVSAPRITRLVACLSTANGSELEFERQLDRSTPAALFHTGGTTGLPKLAQHLHGNQLHTGWSGALYYGLTPDDVILNGFPLFHVAGAFVYGLAAVTAGASQVLPTQLGMRSASFQSNYWAHIQRWGVSVVASVPTTLSTVLGTTPGAGQGDSVRVFMTGGSPLPTELADAVEARFAKPVRNIFGMTESAGLISVEPFAGPRTPGSAGLPLPYSEVRAVRYDANGAYPNEPLATGDVGVLAARGPNVTPGYTDTSRNAGTFTDDGWLLSGDLGHVDAAGRVTVTGRVKDVIIRGAHNIDPGIIEEVALAHPSVELAAAIGQPDAYAGEVPVLYVTLHNGAEISEQRLLASVAKGIPEPPARPKRVAIWPALPITAVGKIYKPTLRVDATRFALNQALSPIVRAPATFVFEVEERAGTVAATVAVAGADEVMCAAVRSALIGFPIALAINFVQRENTNSE
jgi:fatty-acyl-CoA synthase